MKCTYMRGRDRLKGAGREDSDRQTQRDEGEEKRGWAEEGGQGGESECQMRGC